LTMTDALSPAVKRGEPTKILQMFWSNYIEKKGVTTQSYWNFYLGGASEIKDAGNIPNHVLPFNKQGEFPVSARDQAIYEQNMKNKDKKKRLPPNTLQDAVIDGQWRITVDGSPAMFEGIGRQVEHVKGDPTQNEVGWLHFYDSNGRENRPAVMCVADKEQQKTWWRDAVEVPSPPLARCVW
jgi:hypothetical protein